MEVELCSVIHKALLCRRCGGDCSPDETQKFSIERSTQRARTSKSQETEGCGPGARKAVRLLSRNAMRTEGYNIQNALSSTRKRCGKTKFFGPN